MYEKIHTAVLSRVAPSAVRIGFGSAEFDLQGRYVEVDLPRVTVGSLYLPKGEVAGEKWDSTAGGVVVDYNGDFGIVVAGLGPVVQISGTADDDFIIRNKQFRVDI